MLCNDIKREGAKPSPGLVSGLFCYVPLHNIRYGINGGGIEANQIQQCALIHAAHKTAINGRDLVQHTSPNASDLIKH